MVSRAPGLPSALVAAARGVRLGPSAVPALLAHPDWEGAAPVPIVIWMHGRTASKELDPGRYLRWLRAGIGVCAVDLPGHGERFDASRQTPDQTLDVLCQMVEEIDEIVEAVTIYDEFDHSRIGIGGMSAGGMATLARLCRPHPFTCASVEAASGSWSHQRHRPMFRRRSIPEVGCRDPIGHLDEWREVPLQAIHSRHDTWVSFRGQTAFIDTLRARYRRPELIEFIVYDRTGAPHEHAGFGRLSSEAKNRQRAFLRRWLIDGAGESADGGSPATG